MKRVFCCATLVALLLAPLAGVSRAQEADAGAYLEPLPMAAEALKKQDRQKMQTAYSKVMRGLTSFDAQGQQELRAWIEGYIIPAMTSPDHYAEIGENRRDVMKDLQTAKTAEIHDFTVQLLFDAMQPLVEGNYPPPTRVNAMLVITELNQVEISSGIEMFTPLPTALPYIRQQLNDANQIDGVRLVALAGIHRHVESQWWAPQPPPADWINGLKQEMLAIVTETEPPAGRSADAHAWFRGRAADVLGSLCGWAPDPNSLEALAAILADANAPISLRCRASYALGRFDYKKMQGTGAAVNVDDVTANIAGLLADACEIEITWLEKERDEIAASGVVGGGGISSLGGGMPATMPMGPTGGRATGGEEDEEDERGGASRSSRGSSPFGGGSTRSSAPGAVAGPDTGGVPQYIVDGARRRLLYELTCVDASVNGPPTKKSDFKGLKEFAGGQGDAASNITAIEAEIEKLGKTLRKDNYRLTELIKDVRASMQKLDRLRPQPAASAADSADADSAIPEASEVPVEEEVPIDDAVPADDVPVETTEEAPIDTDDAAADPNNGGAAVEEDSVPD